jgi:hypothetical protein
MPLIILRYEGDIGGVKKGRTQEGDIGGRHRRGT